MNNKTWAWPMTNWLSHLQWFVLWMRSVCVAVWLRLLGMLNLNDGRWGRGEDQPRNTANGSDPGQPTPPPEGNRRPPPAKGPPDLDELWQDLNRKLGQLFGGKGGPGGNPPGSGGGFQPPFKNAGLGLGLVLGVLAMTMTQIHYQNVYTNIERAKYGIFLLLLKINYNF